ncbi:MAG TPA: M48 family metalloprotease, partial [Chitinophagaceae bacterium]|nr:M48 family metalloprotease [Chitinophagaceae bacterium]
SQIVLSLLLGDFSVAGSILLRNADELKNLSYSRSLESEADAEGARLLAARGIDCRGFVQLFRLLKRESGAAEPNEWLSSHPNLDKRMEQIRKLDFCTQQPPEDSTLRHRFLQLKTY